jgi:hypothetical protein
VDNIKMDLREIGWDGMDWIDLVQPITGKQRMRKMLKSDKNSVIDSW